MTATLETATGILESTCDYCAEVVPDGARFCGVEHQILDSIANRPQDHRNRQERRGPVYEMLAAQGLFTLLDEQRLTTKQAKTLLATAGQGQTVTETAINRALNAWRSDREIAAVAVRWEPSSDAERAFGPKVPDGLDTLDGDARQAWVNEAVEAFLFFRERYFQTAGHPYVSASVHRLMAREAVEAFYFGGWRGVLAPARSGKTELLIHFVIWLIVRHPNVRILWVGGSGSVAALAGNAIRNALADPELAEVFLPPGDEFKGRDTWTKTEFTVATRTDHRLKSPTFTSVGMNGTLFSRDCDFLIGDDLVDDRTVNTAEGRDGQREWFQRSAMSRLSKRSGAVLIGSRQHADDLYATLEDSDNWTLLPVAAHDPNCDLHVDAEHVDCLVVPELLDWTFLRKKRADLEATGQMHIWELHYEGKAAAVDSLLFTRDLVEAAYNRERGLGLPDELRRHPGGHVLLAGCDPAGSGVQAHVLVAVSVVDPDHPKIHLIDGALEQPGGTDKLAQWIDRWGHQYGDGILWIVEQNSLQDLSHLNNPLLKRSLGLAAAHIRPHQTGENKVDADIGVAAMAHSLEAGIYDFPYRGGDAQRLINLLTRQMVNYDPERRRKKQGTDDLLMALWFTYRKSLDVIRAARRDHNQRERITQRNASFPGYHATSYPQQPWGNEPPWGRTGYRNQP